MKVALITILVLGVVGTGAYFLLQDNNSFRVSFFGQGVTEPPSRNSSPTRSSTPEEIKNTAGAIGHSVISAVESAGSWIGEKGKELFTSVVGGAQSAVTDAAKNVAQDTFSSVGNALGISSTSSEDLSLSVSYVIQKGAETSFVLRDALYNKSQESIAYHIDWGDGSVYAEKNIPVRETYTFSHAWEKTGEYTISFRIIRADKESIYTTNITVK